MMICPTDQLQDDASWATRDQDRSWVASYNGGKIHPLELRADEVDIADLAAALACLPRFAGRTRSHYSVAQHCVLGSRQRHNPREALVFLLHDVGEAVLGWDIPRPIKRDPRFAFLRDLEEVNRRLIFDQLGLEPELPAWVHEVDDRMLATERRDLFTKIHPDWNMTAQPYEFRIFAWTPTAARNVFLEQFETLSLQIK